MHLPAIAQQISRLLRDTSAASTPLSTTSASSATLPIWLSATPSTASRPTASGPLA